MLHLWLRHKQGSSFDFEQDTQSITIVAHSGVKNLDLSALYGLKVSSVYDVMQTGESILEKHVSEKALARFGKLLALLPFEACLGVPIKVQGEIRHAAFFFHSHVDAFSNYQLRDMQAGAFLLSEVLSEEIVQKRLLKL